MKLIRSEIQEIYEVQLEGHNTVILYYNNGTIFSIKETNGFGGEMSTNSPTLIKSLLKKHRNIVELIEKEREKCLLKLGN